MQSHKKLFVPFKKYSKLSIVQFFHNSNMVYNITALQKSG